MISAERKNELLFYWQSERTEGWSQEWREELDADESALVEEWDYEFYDSNLAQ